MNNAYIPRYGNKSIDRNNIVETDKIFKLVQEYFGITREELLLKTKRITIVYPRQVCIYFLAKHSVHSLRGISVMFGFKDSGSAACAVTMIKNYLATDDKVKDQIEELEAKLKA